MSQSLNKILDILVTHGRRGCGGRRELVVVVEGALYTCPWGALRGTADAEPLCERYALLASPALRPLKHHRHTRVKPQNDHSKLPLTYAQN